MSIFVLSWLRPFIWLSIELMSESTDDDDVTAGVGEASVPVIVAEGAASFVEVDGKEDEDLAAIIHMIQTIMIITIIVTIVFPVFDMCVKRCFK